MNLILLPISLLQVSSPSFSCQPLGHSPPPPPSSSPFGLQLNPTSTIDSYLIISTPMSNTEQVVNIVKNILQPQDNALRAQNEKLLSSAAESSGSELSLALINILKGTLPPSTSPDVAPPNPHPLLRQPARGYQVLCHHPAKKEPLDLQRGQVREHLA